MIKSVSTEQIAHSYLGNSDELSGSNFARKHACHMSLHDCVFVCQGPSSSIIRFLRILKPVCCAPIHLIIVVDFGMEQDLNWPEGV